MRVVRRFGEEDADACLEIIRGLPDFFTDEEHEQITLDLMNHEAWVITDGLAALGFIVVERRFPYAAELLWMAVDLKRRGQGAGTTILTHVLRRLAADGVSLVEVKTLDKSADYEPYEMTRAFWQQRGFHHVDTIDPMPGWPPGNPAALYIAALRPTIGLAGSRQSVTPSAMTQHRKEADAAILHPLATLA